jgi:hypothetical protein
MAKGQKKSNRETRKPKQAGSKSSGAAPSTFLSGAHAGSIGSKSTGRPKGG